MLEIINNISFIFPIKKNYLFSGSNATISSFTTTTTTATPSTPSKQLKDCKKKFIFTFLQTYQTLTSVNTNHIEQRHNDDDDCDDDNTESENEE